MLDITRTSLLINRPLEDGENSNFDLYLEIATKRLERLLGVSLKNMTGDRTYLSRFGYRSLYVYPFTAVTAVSIDGVVNVDYVEKQNDYYDGDWYNVLEFTDKLAGQPVVVTGQWGFDVNAAPADLQLLLARLFVLVSYEQTLNTHVKTKKMIDYLVTYNDTLPFDEFIALNQSVIDTYSASDVGVIAHGEVNRTVRSDLSYGRYGNVQPL